MATAGCVAATYASRIGALAEQNHQGPAVLQALPNERTYLEPTTQLKHAILDIAMPGCDLRCCTWETKAIRCAMQQLADPVMKEILVATHYAEHREQEP